MSTSTDGGLTWGPSLVTADTIHGLGGQPVVQPNGRLVVPFEGINHGQGIRAFTSDDSGLSWNRSVRISTVASHDVRGLRTSPLPSAEINAVKRNHEDPARLRSRPAGHEHIVNPAARRGNPPDRFGFRLLRERSARARWRQDSWPWSRPPRALLNPVATRRARMQKKLNRSGNEGARGYATVRKRDEEFAERSAWRVRTRGHVGSATVDRDSRHD